MYLLVSNIAIAACYVPILLILWKKLREQTAFIIIGLYWMASGLINLPSWIGHAQNSNLQNTITLVYNLIDGPLVLLFFLFSAKRNKRKVISYALIFFLLFELIVITVKGYNMGSSTIIVGLDTFFALTFSIAGIAEYLSKLEHTPSENTLVFINSALLFSYGVFIIIYYFSYLGFAKSKSENIEVFLIYYISMLLSSLLTCYGLWRYTKKPIFERGLSSY
jgi:hypothetical protein